MTERSFARGQGLLATRETAPRVESGITRRVPEPVHPVFEALYRSHFRFVFRSIARLGVPYLLVDRDVDAKGLDSGPVEMDEEASAAA